MGKFAPKETFGAAVQTVQRCAGTDRRGLIRPGVNQSEHANAGDRADHPTCSQTISKPIPSKDARYPFVGSRMSDPAAGGQSWSARTRQRELGVLLTGP